MNCMTRNGVSTTVAEQEQYESFKVRLGRKTLTRMQYDYRMRDGVLFSTVAGSLEECRQRRNHWLTTQKRED